MCFSLRIFFTIALAAFICTIFGCGSGGSGDGSGNSGKVSSNDSIPTPIGAGKYHSVALKSDGTVWTWGDNYYGQLGDGSSDLSSGAPVQVSGLAKITAITAGDFHTLALKSDGTVWTWGSNGNGQLGDGTTADSATPVQVIGLTGVASSSRAADIHTIPWRE
ncbi:MAG TPA: hypothetical protein VEE82_01195 [Thermodesulfovibrionales bacterium]|nr:hypothetical protein [Thermodesulfovibrionales bacterium]